jgi:hypothetical protein
MGITHEELEYARVSFAEKVAEHQKHFQQYQPSPPCDINDIPGWYPDCLKTYLSKISMDIMMYEMEYYLAIHEFEPNKPVFDAVKLDGEIQKIGLREYYEDKKCGRYKPDRYDCSIEHVHKCNMELEKMYYESVELLSLGCSNSLNWYTETNTVQCVYGDDSNCHGITFDHRYISDGYHNGESLTSFLGFYG